MKKFIEVIKLLIPLGLILFFTNGRWVIPIAVWISTPLLLRLSRELKLLSVVLIITPLLFIVNLIIWKNIIPLPVPLYQIVSLITSIFTLIPFLIDGLLYQKTNRTLSILIFPLSFVSFHFIFSKISPSGTFGSIAYTQTNIYLLQIISITGIWGIIFLIGLFSSLINYAYEYRSNPKEFRQAILILACIIILPLIYGFIRMHSGNENISTVKTAGLLNEFHFNKRVDRNIVEFDSVSLNQQNQLLDRTIQSARKGAKFVVWQEAALFIRKNREKQLIECAGKIAKENRINIGAAVLSVPDNFPNSPAENKIIWINPDGEVAFEYIKGFPTPDEFVIRGNRIFQYTNSKYGEIGSFICFDMNFPDYIKQAGKEGIHILFVPSNDWKEITPYHTKLASFRAIEQGFNLFRVTGHGYSAAYDVYGNELASFNFYKEKGNEIYADIPFNNIKTIYSSVGDLFFWCCIVSLFISLAYIFFYKKYFSRPG